MFDFEPKRLKFILFINVIVLRQVIKFWKFIFVLLARISLLSSRDYWITDGSSKTTGLNNRLEVWVTKFIILN